jgi:uncharacterized membrane protein
VPGELWLSNIEKPSVAIRRPAPATTGFVDFGLSLEAFSGAVREPSANMSKPIGWLLGEIERWRREQLITAEQATQIRALYPETQRQVSWGLVLFSGLGAVVVGLGIILLLAYNWAAIPKFGKLALIFGGIVAAHGTGLWLRWKTQPAVDVGEAFSVLGTMLFGSGIWLVAQVYHIDEHFPNGFLIWGLGALLLTWSLRSVPHGILATVILTIWGSSELMTFDAPMDWSPLLVVVGVGPLVWRKRSAILGAVLLVSLGFLLGTHAAYWSGGAGAFSVILAISVLLLGVERLRAASAKRDALDRVMVFFGWVGFLGCAYVLTFEGAVRGMLRWETNHGAEMVPMLLYRWIVFIAALLAWGIVLARHFGRKGTTVPLEEWLCPIALIYCQGLAVAGYYDDRVFVAVVFNLIAIGVAVMWMVRGCREGRLRPTVVGSLFFAAIVFARYFDLFESLAVRGVIFLLLGAGLFAEGFYYRRMKHASVEGGAS